MLTKFLGLPEPASDHADVMDHMLDLVQWFALILAVGWSVYFVIVLIRFWRGRVDHADYRGVRSHASTHLEIGVVLFEALLLLAFAFPLWNERVEEFPNGPEVLECRVIAYRFGWQVHYPGKDGLFGYTDPTLYSADNPLGLDPDDPNGADDVFEQSLTIPVNHPVIMWTTAKDVIHNVAIVDMRVAIDSIPGTEHRFHFRPTELGSYDIICGQLCGEGHSRMKGTCNVVTEEEWKQNFSHLDNLLLDIDLQENS